MEPVEIKGLNPDYDLYMVYLEEFYHGITELDFEDWKADFLADDNDDDIDWELMDMALELAEADEE